MVEARTLARQVYEHLLRSIFAGELKAGTRLREDDLAARLGVSRTPVREALGRLAEFGVVESRPNHGCIVRRMGREELVYLHQMREALEGMAAELACGRLTKADFARLDALAEAARDESSADYFKAFDEFDVGLHRLLAARSGNPLMAREIQKLQDMTMLIHDQLESVLIGGQLIDPAEQWEIRRICHREHMEILDALRSGSPEDCRAAMVAHIRAMGAYKSRLMPETAPPSGEVGRSGSGSSRPRRGRERRAGGGAA